jgi:hypothetical protein
MQPTERVSALRGGFRWSLSLGGLALFVLAVLALSGPGRIDIVDGQARYLVARSLVDHGEPAVREPGFWWSVLPGRDGRLYSAYRFPHSLAGVPAILLADATGPVSEPRRQFFFSLVGAALGAVLAVVYAMWFRGQGHSPASSAGWALAGIFCTPNWFYATSTFDDLLGEVFLVAAVGLAWWGRGARPFLGAALAGLALGLAANVKQPLGLFALPLLALVFAPGRPWRTGLGAAALLLGGLALCLGAYQGYEWYKFPPESRAAHAELLARYVPPWPGNTTAGLCGLLLSPAAGVLWYCPPVALGLTGMYLWRRREQRFVLALAVACAGFTVFVSTMTIFKGDPCWGPRYLTPLIGVLWLFVPTAAGAWPARHTRLLLALGVVVQLLGLSVDPHRLYVHHSLPSAFYFGHEWVYFHPAVSHLVNRPREIREILQDDGRGTTTFGPAPLATSAPPVLEEMDRGPEAVRKYRILASLRPWWVSQRWLEPTERPVALGPTAALLGALALLGGLPLIVLCRARPPEEEAPELPSRAEQKVTSP